MSAKTINPNAVTAIGDAFGFVVYLSKASIENDDKEHTRGACYDMIGCGITVVFPEDLDMAGTMGSLPKCAILRQGLLPL